MAVCMMCGRMLKGIESVERGYGPVCYRRLNPKALNSKMNDDRGKITNDIWYNLPGQMELKDFIAV